MIPFRKEMIQNCDKCSGNPDWNGMLYNGKKVGIQPKDMVPRFLTIKLPDDPKQPHLFEPIILLTQPLVKQPNSHSRFQPCPFRNLSFSLYSHVRNDPR